MLELGEFTEDDQRIYARIMEHIPTSALTRAPTGHSTLTKDIKAINSDRTLDTTAKEALVNARVGQGAFRSAVLQLWNRRCVVTGSAMLDAIRASHIKPWRNSTNPERLDPKNGFPLVASLDALFDAGLISFDGSGRMLVSPQLHEAERKIFGIDGRKLTKVPITETADYLDYHRKKIYRA